MAQKGGHKKGAQKGHKKGTAPLLDYSLSYYILAGFICKLDRSRIKIKIYTMPRIATLLLGMSKKIRKERG